MLLVLLVTFSYAKPMQLFDEKKKKLAKTCISYNIFKNIAEGPANSKLRTL